MEPIGERLKKYRESVGLTQRQVAIALDVTVTTVQNWESGRHVPRLTLNQTKILCDLLKVSLEDLVD